MIKAKFTFEDKSANLIKRFLTEVEGAQDSYVTIGVHSDAGKYSDGIDPPEVVEVALWTEFGTKSMPERSWLRSAIDDNIETINQWRVEAIQKIMRGEWNVQKSLESLGFRIQVLVQNKIQSNVPPPLSDSTIKQKMADGVPLQTLEWTMLMFRSVTYKVVMG